MCVCMFACLLICLLAYLLAWTDHSTVYFKWALSSISQKLNVHSSAVKTWCHFKVTNNAYWWRSNGKNCGYKLQEWLYGLSSNGFIVLWLSEFEFWRLVALLYMQKHLKECLPPCLMIFKVLRLWVLLLTHLRDYGTWQKLSSSFKCEA